MKKNLWILLILILPFSITACDGNDPQPEQENSNTETPNNGDYEGEGDNKPNPKGKYLVVWYSWSGNSKNVATELQKLVNGDIIEIVPTIPYPDYQATAIRYREELATIENSGQYPSLNTEIESFDNYDIVFVCYPLWGSRMSTPTQAFLYKHRSKLEGKTIALVCSTASSGISQTVEDAKQICLNSTFTEALNVYSSEVNSVEKILSKWLQKILLINT